MFNKTELRLALYNVGVFATVLIIFSTIIYFSLLNGIYTELRSDLTHLADGVISSIDFDDGKQQDPDSASPDLIESVLPESQSQSLKDMGLQWFDRKKKLVKEKGNLKISLPLNSAEGFEEQQNPHAMLFTKSAYLGQQLLGYARVGQPLKETDNSINYLRVGLSLGVFVSSILSGAGIVFLIRKAMQPLNENLQQLKQFTADASHELRSPVMAITSNSKVALKYAQGMRDTDKEKFEFILAASRQMGRLVDDLLKLTRAANDTNVSAATPQSLDLVLNEVRRLMAWLEEEKHIQLHWQVAEHLTVNGCQEDLQHLFRNLIENAYRYSLDGGTVTISAGTEQEQIVVKVKDSGIGIAACDLPKVFDRFWRSDKARSASTGGNGLGLSIAKSIVEEMNGSITVESEPERGTTFTVRLPKSNQPVS